MDLHGRNLLQETDLTAAEFIGLVDLGEQMRTEEPLTEVTYRYLGDGRNNVANSLLVTGALLGMDVRICAPAQLQPAPAMSAIAATAGDVR